MHIAVLLIVGALICGGEASVAEGVHPTAPLPPMEIIQPGSKVPDGYQFNALRPAPPAARDFDARKPQ